MQPSGGLVPCSGAQEVNRLLSSYQSTPRFLVGAGLEPVPKLRTWTELLMPHTGLNGDGWGEQMIHGGDS